MDKVLLEHAFLKVILSSPGNNHSVIAPYPFASALLRCEMALTTQHTIIRSMFKFGGFFDPSLGWIRSEGVCLISEEDKAL
jgi:hypothetical protein